MKERDSASSQGDEDMNAEQRANLLKLAEYLESLPPDYSHFSMTDYINHRGSCEIENIDQELVLDPQAALMNCGTIACAAGHGPAAGFPILESETEQINGYLDILWPNYMHRVFGVEDGSDEWAFLFGAWWIYYDNHHYGAAARIRYFLENDMPEYGYQTLRSIYEQYRKSEERA
jgi:hypothetical protein